MRYETITLDVAQGIATITLNRPEAYNALSLTLGRELFGAGSWRPKPRTRPCAASCSPERARPSAAAGTSRSSRRACRAWDPDQGADDVHSRGGLAARADAEARDHRRQRRGRRRRAGARAGGRSRGRRRVPRGSPWPTRASLPRRTGRRPTGCRGSAASAGRWSSSTRTASSPRRKPWSGGLRRGPSPTRSSPPRCEPWPRGARPGAVPWRSGGASGFSTSRRPRASRPRWSTRARRSRRAGTPRISRKAWAAFLEKRPPVFHGR